MGTYIEWYCINCFSAKFFHHFEGMGHTLWSVLVPSNGLKGFPSVPCEQDNVFSGEKIRVFKSTAAIKQQQRLTNLTNLTMVCYHCSSFLYLPVALVDCQVEGCPSRLHHICQGGYVVWNYIDFDGAERNICYDCVDELQGKGK